MMGKFWQMHDILYENQNAWASSSNPQPFFNAYAQQLGLNVTTFKQDMGSDKVNNLINADLAAFAKTNQTEATPTFFLDGKYISNTNLIDNNQPSVQKFANVINAEIASKNPSSKK